MWAQAREKILRNIWTYYIVQSQVICEHNDRRQTTQPPPLTHESQNFLAKDRLKEIANDL